MAVDPSGNMRLLGPDFNGQYATQLKKHEVLVEIPSRELVLLLQDEISEQESMVNALQDLIENENNIS